MGSPPQGSGRWTWVGGSHCLPPSSLCSGLLYLNDDFHGGDLFFTEPNALTVTVSRVGAVGVWGEPSCGL